MTEQDPLTIDPDQLMPSPETWQDQHGAPLVIDPDQLILDAATATASTAMRANQNAQRSDPDEWIFDTEPQGQPGKAVAAELASRATSRPPGHNTASYPKPTIPARTTSGPTPDQQPGAEQPERSRAWRFGRRSKKQNPPSQYDDFWAPVK